MLTGHAQLEAAEVALATGEYDAAVEVAERAAADGLVEARFLLGGLRLMDERYDDAREQWEVAFEGLRAQGDHRLAARAAIELAELHAATLGHPSAANGWLERARRELDLVGPCAERGYLELAVMGCDRVDVDDLLASTERAMAIAVEQGDQSLEARALSDQGLALVTTGRVREGLAALDAALAAISAGHVDPVSVGLCFCSMLSACDRAADVPRAHEWTELIRAVFAPLYPRPVVMFTHCRVAYGSVLCESGRWEEGEALLLEALGPPEAPVTSHRATTIGHLAALRLEQGRVDEAATLLAPFEDHVAACGPLARVHHTRGELDLAAAVLRRGVEELAGDALRRGPLLSELVEVELARGDLDAARAFAGSLAELAAAAESAVLRAAARRAEGQVLLAEGDRRAAIAALRGAKELLPTDEHPLRLSRLRLELAELLAAEDDAIAAIGEARAALACFDRLGAAPSRDRAAALLRSLGDTGQLRPQRAADLDSLLTPREREVLGLVAEGLTNADVAERLYISKKTAEHHVGRVLMKLGVRNRAEAAALAVRLAGTERPPSG